MVQITVDRDGKHVYIRQFKTGAKVKCQTHDAASEEEAKDFIRDFLTRAKRKGGKLRQREETCFEITFPEHIK